MKSVTVAKGEKDFSGIDQLKEILMRLVETHPHELPDEAINSRYLVKDYFLRDVDSK